MLTVHDGERQLELRRDDVLAVHFSMDDSTRDGFWHGFTAGAVVSGFGLFMMCATTHDCSADFAAAGAGLGAAWGLLGGVIGMNIDRLRRTEVTWPAEPRETWRVAPVLAPDRQGVAVSLSF